MTETHPPRLAEAILESFGANVEFRDAILGDMAQEHAGRVERFGARAARLWYYRQALLAAPALLRNWLAGARWADARRLLNVVGLAYVTTVMINLCVFFGAAAVGTTLLPKAAWNSVVSVGAFVAVFAVPICAGFLAATFEESKPMVAALALAFLWGAFQVVAGIYVYFVKSDTQLDMPGLARIAMVPIMMAACALGGVMRVRRVSAHRVAAASSTPS